MPRLQIRRTGFGQTPIVQCMGSRIWIMALMGAVLVLLTGCGESDEDKARDVAVRFKKRS